MGNRVGSSPTPDIFFNKSAMPATRPQWPHTVEDIVKALDGVWGVVGAIASSGNLLRLERSLKAPLVYRFVEYKGTDESCPLRDLTFGADQKADAVKEFAMLLGFRELDC